MFRRQLVIASVVLALSATAFALTRNNPEPQASRAQTALDSVSPGPERSTATVSTPIRPAAWLARQDPRFFTVQIFADTDDYAIPAFTRQWQPDQPLARYQIKRHGELWHFLTYGVFPTAAAAGRAVAGLPRQIRLFSPRVQPLSRVIARLHGVGDADAAVAAGRNGETAGPSVYAISLYSAETVAELRQFISENRIDDAYYARARDSADPWVTLLKGRYASLPEARRDLQALPAKVREYAWIKKLGSPNLQLLSFGDPHSPAGAADSAPDSLHADRRWLAARQRDDLLVLVTTGANRKHLLRVVAGMVPDSKIHLLDYSVGGARRYAAVIGGFPDYNAAQVALGRIRARAGVSPVMITAGVLKDAASGDAGSAGLLHAHDPAKTRVAQSAVAAR